MGTVATGSATLGPEENCHSVCGIPRGSPRKLIIHLKQCVTQAMCPGAHLQSQHWESEARDHNFKMSLGNLATLETLPQNNKIIQGRAQSA